MMAMMSLKKILFLIKLWTINKNGVLVVPCEFLIFLIVKFSILQYAKQKLDVSRFSNVNLDTSLFYRTFFNVHVSCVEYASASVYRYGVEVGVY